MGQTENKVQDGRLKLSHITNYINGKWSSVKKNASVKKQRLSKWIKGQNKTYAKHKKPTLKHKDIGLVTVKRWMKTYHANSNNKKV